MGNDPVNWVDPSGLIVAAIPFVEPLIAPAAEEALAWGAKALAGTAIGSYIGNKIPIPHFTPHSLEDRLAAVPRTLRPARVRTFPHVKPTAKPTSLAKQMEAAKTKAKDGAAIEQTKEEDPCDDAKKRKEKFCKSGESFKIGNTSKRPDAIKKMVTKAKTKPSAAKKLKDNGIDCDSVNEKLKNQEKCTQARKDVAEICHGGADGPHAAEIESSIRAEDNIKSILEEMGCQ